jgi:hypothetical protein
MRGSLGVHTAESADVVPTFQKAADSRWLKSSFEVTDSANIR